MDVALVTQCSVERIPLLEALSKHWPGTISVAIYLTDAEVQNFLDFVRSSADLRTRRNIAYHVVYKDGVRCGVFSLEERTRIYSFNVQRQSRTNSFPR